MLRNFVLAIGLTAALCFGQVLKDVKVLLLNFSYGFDHTQARGIFLAKMDTLKTELGFTMDVATDSSAITYDNLSKYDIVVFNNVNGSQAISLQKKNDFQKYIKDGGAWYGMHASCINLTTQWSWYINEFIGGQWKDHPLGIAKKPVRFDSAFLAIKDRGSKETAKSYMFPSLADTMTMTDEWYNLTPDPTSKVLVWMTVNPGATSFVNPTKTPIMWNRRVGLGHYWYTSMGHDRTIFNYPQTHQMFKAGFLHASGYIGCKDTTDKFSIGKPMHKPNFPVINICADSSKDDGGSVALAMDLVKNPYIYFTKGSKLFVQSLSGVKVEVINAAGKIVSVRQKTNDLQLELNPGLYFVSITTKDKQLKTHKVVLY